MMRVEIHMRTGHLFWAKNRQTSEMISLNALLDEYWSSTKLEFTIPSQLRSQTSRSFLMVKCRRSYH